MELLCKIECSAPETSGGKAIRGPGRDSTAVLLMRAALCFRTAGGGQERVLEPGTEGHHNQSAARWRGERGNK